MTDAARQGPAISAHRGGSENAPGGTYRAYQGALAAGAEYVEVDVRRTADGVLVACHRARAGWGRAVGSLSYARLCELAGYEVPRIAVVLPLLAGRAIAHLDLKEASCAAEAVRQAAEVLGPAGVVATTRDGELAASVKRRIPGVPVGVTVGGDLAETTGVALRRGYPLGPGRLDRVLAAQGDWAVLHRRAAYPALLDACRGRGIKTMVWTVNSDRALARWLADPGVDVVVTDRPARALALRGDRDQMAAPPVAAPRDGAPAASYKLCGVRRAAAPAAATGGSLALPCRDVSRRARHRESLPA